MPSAHLEIEDKYEVAEDAELPALEGWPDVVSVDSQRFELEATYFDTDDLRAARSRITVRRRTGGADAGWHVKLPAGAEPEDGRTEIHLPLGHAVHTVPKVLRDRLRATSRGEAMSPVAVLRTDRTVYRLRDAERAVLAEVSDDRVSARNCRTGTMTTWREWEVELVDGGRGLLETARERLTGEAARPSASGSKLARVLGDPPPAIEQPARPRRKGPAGDVVGARLYEEYGELLRRDPDVRGDVDGSVHQMRVATRRLRTALATYRPFLDRAVTDPLREELKWLGDALGESRDAQVQARYLARHLDRLDDDLPGSAQARAAVDAGIEAWSVRARHDLHVALGSERYLALLDRFEELLTDPPFTDAARRPVSVAMTERVRHEWSRAVERLRAVGDVDEDHRDEALHEARKAFKRARYAVEPLQALYGRDARKLVTRLKRVQTRLGDQHDAVFAQSWLRTTVRDLPSGQAAAGFPLGILHERLEVLKAHEEHRFEKAWKAASRPAVRAWLG